MVYGGTIRAGRSCHGKPLTVMSAFEAYGAYAKGTMSEADRLDVVEHACPGPGACGGMYTANTSTPELSAPSRVTVRGLTMMSGFAQRDVGGGAAAKVAVAIEALGLSLPYSSSIPAEDPRKLEEWCAVRGRGPSRRSRAG